MQLFRVNGLWFVCSVAFAAPLSSDQPCGKANSLGCHASNFEYCCSFKGLCKWSGAFSDANCTLAYPSHESHSDFERKTTLFGSNERTAGTAQVMAVRRSSCPNVSTGDSFDDPQLSKECLATREMGCYALPYGGLGFLSDILTIYTVIMLSLGYSPWFPRRELRGGMIDQSLGTLSICGTVGSSIYTIYRCSGAHWSFAMLGTWRMILSISLAAMTIHAARQASNKDKPEKVGRWLFFYAIGLAFGLTGLTYISYVSPGGLHAASGNKVPVGLMSAAFALAIVSPVVIIRYCGWDPLWVFKRDKVVKKKNFWPWPTVLISFAIYFGITMALASDWILASIAHNYSGVPSKNHAVVFWIYFASKRLPFFSI